MKHLIPLLALCALPLAGCNTLEQDYAAVEVAYGTSASPQLALAAANSFDALETVATGYLQLPLCGASAPVTCRTLAASKAIVPAVRSGRAARNAIETLLSQNSGAAIPIARLNTLNAAISALDAVYANYHISAK